MVPPPLDLNSFLMSLSCAWHDMVPSEDVDSCVAEGNHEDVENIRSLQHNPKREIRLKKVKSGSYREVP